MIRRAIPADARPIAEVHVRTWQEAYRGIVPDAVLDALDVDERERSWNEWIGTPPEGAETFVADEHGAVVGFVNVGRDRSGEAGVGELNAIYLREEHWGRGIGQALMERAVAALSAAGYDEAVLWVLADNVRTRRFYEAAGWAADGAEQELEGLGLPEVRYRRRLV